MSKLCKHSRFQYWYHSVYTTLLITPYSDDAIILVYLQLYRLILRLAVPEEFPAIDTDHIGGHVVGFDQVFNSQSNILGTPPAFQ
jgi:hypothetical protein